jgi:hypothetical protein
MHSMTRTRNPECGDGGGWLSVRDLDIIGAPLPATHKATAIAGRCLRGIRCKFR